MTKDLTSTAVVMGLKVNNKAVFLSKRTQDTVKRHPHGVIVTSEDSSQSMSVGTFQNLYKKQMWIDESAKGEPNTNA